MSLIWYASVRLPRYNDYWSVTTNHVRVQYLSEIFVLFIYSDILFSSKMEARDRHHDY